MGRERFKRLVVRARGPIPFRVEPGLGLRAQGIARSTGLRNILEPLSENPRFELLLARVDSFVAVERRRAEREGWGELPTR
jgi:hypothetical protein